MDKTYNDELYGDNESSRIEMERQDFLDTLERAEEGPGQGIGTDRDGPFTDIKKLDEVFSEIKQVDYAWNSIHKKQGFDPSKNYYSEMESFAESIGFHMSQSNGIYTLRPCAPNPVSNDEEIAEFKRQHPEYRNMKGTKNIGNRNDGTFVNYKLNAGIMEFKDGFREKRMRHWLKEQVRWSDGTKQALKYLHKNSYRKLQKKTICKKFSWFDDDTTLIKALTELGYLESSFNTKAKLCYQLTEKGKEYVRSIN